MTFGYSGQRLHFVGAGGISMSGLMRLCAHYGAVVSGSDRNDSETLAALADEGYEVYRGTNPAVAARADLVVYTSAIPPHHPERLAARCSLERSRLLCAIAQGYDVVIAVAGTHGKTTVCGFLASILLEAGAPFCAHIGGYIPRLGGSVYLGGDRIFVTEACEYQQHFLGLNPTIGLITNVEYDHPDYYPDLAATQAAYARFGSQCGRLVCGDGVVCSMVHKNTCLYAQPYVLPAHDDTGAFAMMFDGAYIQTTLGVWGEFNRQNAALAAAGALLAGVEIPAIRRGLAAYTGAKRRQQVVGTWRGMPVVSDYAHHPSEIAALLGAAKERWGDVCVVFQPHTYTRTEALLARFATCFDCETLYLLPTFAAREAYMPRMDERLWEAVSVRDKHLCTPQKFWQDIAKTPHKKYGAILFVGAGDIHAYAMSLLRLD